MAFCSCRSYMFFPDRVCVAGLEKKGEWKANVSAKPQLLNTVPSYISLSGDGVYAISDKLYCIASYRNILNKGPITETNGKAIVKYNGHRVDIGVGTMAPFNDRWSFEAAGGYGFGIIWRDYQGPPNGNYASAFSDKSFKASYSRLFAQFGFRYMEGSGQITTGLRLSGQFGYRFTPYLSQFDGYDAVSWDPYVDFETGKKLGFNMQSGCSILIGPNQGGFKPYITIGLCYHFSPEKKPIRETKEER
jgi:hypothetical protein